MIKIMKTSEVFTDRHLATKRTRELNKIGDYKYICLRTKNKEFKIFKEIIETKEGVILPRILNKGIKIDRKKRLQELLPKVVELKKQGYISKIVAEEVNLTENTVNYWWRRYRDGFYKI
nr:hypothetical protein [Fusobacterium gastrosuis]